MTHNVVYISNPRIVLPLHSASQSQLLDFLQDAHGRESVGRLLQRYGVKETQISRRSFECSDVFLPAAEREIYGPQGASILQRGNVFSRRAKDVLGVFYPKNDSAPTHLMHVTCTGYVSPSAAQILVGEREWGTEVSHAYHMGCYASLPAIRLAAGQAIAYGKAVDVVHTEMCSLHMNPADRRPEQLIVQSLFADGHAQYRVSAKKEGAPFQLLALHEKILPGSAQDMEWMPAPWGMKMTLSREVPSKIKGALRDFVTTLLAKAGIDLGQAIKEGIFAVHPGGPKIIDCVRESLELSEEQVASSRKILYERGNMSSATLPHVWREICLLEPPEDTPIVSLAFGPGLTIFGGVFLWRP